MLYFLIGFMGCGKSTLGRVLARELGCALVDLDRYVEQREGCSISEIFAQRGELYFRQAERSALEAVIGEHSSAVVSCGGGTPCFGDNMKLMNQAGVTIYLKMDRELLLSRLAKSPTSRPLIEGLSGQALRAKVIEQLEQREPFYAQAAVTVLNCPRDGRRLLAALAARVQKTPVSTQIAQEEVDG